MPAPFRGQRHDFIPMGSLMNGSITAADRDAINGVVAALENAWNTGDGVAFAASMAEDADFVTIRAEHYRGRRAIAEGHAAIFRTIYAGSKNRYTIDSARLLRDDIALIHVRSVLVAPTGPLAGQHEALFSAVLTREGGVWRVAAFHNTLAS